MLKIIKKSFSTFEKKIFKRSITGDTLTSKEITVDRSPKIWNRANTTKTIYANFDEIYSNQYDAIIVGAGHNGLVCANYLVGKGKKVLILEKRHEVGGAAISEELVEGYKISRCSYVLSLFRKRIIDELFGDDFFKNIKLHSRNPYSLTPTSDDKYLLLKTDPGFNEKEIAKFSEKDAIKFREFENFLTKMVGVIGPIIDMEPPGKISIFNKENITLLKHIFKERNNLYQFYHFLTSSASSYLDQYFESEVLKATLATDAVIGAMKSPTSLGSAYVLLHHVMGDIDEKGSWFYVEGGTGTISNYLAKKCVEKGAKILLNSPVQNILFSNEKVCGVRVNDKDIYSKVVVTNCDPYNTYFKLLSDFQRNRYLDKEAIGKLEKIDYTSPVVKINLIVNKLPKFKCLSHLHNNDVDKNEQISKDYMTGTIHLNSETMIQLENAYNDAINGNHSTHPIIEMTIPSILDKTLVPKGSGHHVIGLFTQYAPARLKNGDWDEKALKEYKDRVYKDIEVYCPEFSKSILFEDVLSPKELENEFSLTGGNIFHGTLDINSIYFCRPALGSSSYESNIKNLFSCSSGMHPGGGVMGAVGRNCAKKILQKI